MRRAYLASIVPVIINAALNEHQVIVDIVAFVAKGDFPRSRLGEKQRGKILASWVTRKMETIAQFSIRDADAADSQITEVAEPRSAVGSIRGGSSLKKVETTTQQPTGARETARPYESSIVESPPLPVQEATPNYPGDHQFQPDAELHLPEPEEPSYSQGMLSDPDSIRNQRYDFSDVKTPLDGEANHDRDQAFEFSTPQNPMPPDPHYGSKSNLSLPSLGNHGDFSQDGDLWTLPSQQQVRPQQQAQSYGNGGASRLRVANANNDDDDEWPQEALMHMKLGGVSSAAGGRNRREDRYDGSGYGGGYGNAM